MPGPVTRAARTLLVGTLTLLAAAPAWPAPSTAHAASPPSTEIEIFAGAFMPTAPLFTRRVDLPEPLTDLEQRLRQRSSVALGARASHWLGANVGGEISLLDAPSDLRAGSLDYNTGVFLAAVKLALRARIPGTPVRLHLLGGAALVTRFGDAWVGTRDTSDLAAVAGIGASVPISPRVVIRLDVEDYAYSPTFDDSGVRAPGEHQDDVVASAGLAFPLGGARHASDSRPALTP